MAQAPGEEEAGAVEEAPVDRRDSRRFPSETSGEADVPPPRTECRLPIPKSLSVAVISKARFGFSPSSSLVLLKHKSRPHVLLGNFSRAISNLPSGRVGHERTWRAFRDQCGL